MNSHIISVLVAVGAYSLLDVSKAVQKIGISAYVTHRVRGSLVWMAATLGTTLSSFLVLYAVSMGSVVLVGSLSGTGLAAMLLFSRAVLKEKMGRQRVIAVSAILLGPFLMAGVQIAHPGAVTPLGLAAFAAGVFLAGAVASLALRNSRGAGLTFAATAGSLSGLVVLFQKVSTVTAGRAASFIDGSLAEAPALVRDVAQVVVNPYTVVWILLSVLSTVVLQLAYRDEHVSRTVPVFGAGNILVPVVGGILCFGEVLHALQWMGVASVLAGIVLLLVEPQQE